MGIKFMPHRLEIAIRPDLPDAEGRGIQKKARDYFDIELDSVRVVQINTLDMELTPAQCETIRTEVFTNPITQISSYEPLSLECDWIIWVGFRPGVRDNPGATAIEAIEDGLRLELGDDSAVYTSKRYCIQSPDLSFEDTEKIAGELWPTISSSSGRYSIRLIGILQQA